MENLINFDTQLFYFLNLKLQNQIFDFLMPILTHLYYWKIPLVLAWLGLMIFGKKRSRVVGILLVIVIAIGDQVCNQTIKPWIGRIRPCNILDGVHLLVNCTQSPSFPSSHATNMFSSCILLSYFYKKISLFFLIVALLVSYSRIYVGVHYPFDVLGGITLGFLVFLLVLIVYKNLDKYIFKGKMNILKSS